MTPTKERSAAYRVRQREKLARLKRYEEALSFILKEANLGLGDFDSDGGSYLGRIEDDAKWALGIIPERDPWNASKYS